MNCFIWLYFDSPQLFCLHPVEAVAVFNYITNQEDELNLKVGDIITNVHTFDGGWCEGELNGKKGMFPENFVKVKEENETRNLDP